MEKRITELEADNAQLRALLREEKIQHALCETMRQAWKEVATIWRGGVERLAATLEGQSDSEEEA